MVGTNKLLFESTSSDPTEKRKTIGAFVPALDANYYKEVLIGFKKEDGQYSMGIRSWWAWMKECIKKGDILIDDEFDFDPDEVKIVKGCFKP